MQAGDCYFLRFVDKHLWCVLSDPRVDPARVVVVMFCTWKPYREQTCILHAGDHPFVKHDTCVEYNAAQVMKDADLERHRSLGNMDVRDPLSPELLEKIRQGAGEGDLPIRCINILRDQGIIE